MDVYQHINLLERFDRSYGILQNLNEFITNGDILIDAGCGTGLLSFLSLQGGAEYIYSIERDPIIELAKRISIENGLDNKIKFIQKNLSAINVSDFEKKITGLIAFVYMNDPRRDETQHKLVYNLINKLNLDGVKIIPNQIEYYAQLANMKEYDIDNHKNKNIQRIRMLSDRYRLKLNSMSKEIENVIDLSFFPNRDGCGVYESKFQLSEPKKWHYIDYSEPLKEYPHEIKLQANCEGIPNCVIWRQDLKYNGHLVFSNESVSYISNPLLFKQKATGNLKLNNIWRKTNNLIIDRN